MTMTPKDFMQWWISNNGIKLKASSDLLKYLKRNFDSDLPNDYRTLLKTPKLPVVTEISPGKYIHLGVSNALKNILSESKYHQPSSPLKLQFFVDGLPISKSSNDGLWVIMVTIRNLKKNLKPRTIGVYEGKHKPEDFNEFLYPFVVETLELLKDGFEFEGSKKIIENENFVLDAPARTGIKQVKHINGYFGCDVCLTEGICIDHRMIYPDLDSNVRTDEEFRGRTYGEYHKKDSVLELLPIDMISSFPLDYLHCLLLGVMKWILVFLKTTPKTLSTQD